MIPELNRYEQKFPNPRKHTSPEGILAFGGDLVPSRLMMAYRNGIFPWYSAGDPILWWSPDPRLVLNLEDFKLRKSLKKKLDKFEIKIDKNFEAVLRRCGSVFRAGQKGSWLLPEMIDAYMDLHALGYAHSIEAYQDDKLVGGLYGVVVGGAFCGESMFADVTDASKVAFAFLIEHLTERGFSFIDAQVPTEHLKSLGAVEISRDDFLDKLEKVIYDDVFF